MLVKNIATNLANYIENGRISILTSDDSSSLCTEIVNRMQKGDNVTIVSGSPLTESASISSSKNDTLDSEMSHQSVGTSDPGLIK